MKYFLFLFLVACTTLKPPHSLRISFNTHPTTLDPRKCGDFVSSSLVGLIYDGLTRCSPDGDVQPALASSCEISGDQCTYVFHLREAYWSDGTPITAADFEQSWKKVLEGPGLTAFLFYPIKNAEKCVKKGIAVEAVGIKALDAKTLQVELERPTPYFYSLTAFPSFLPVPSHIQTAETGSIVSGPFQIGKIVQSSEIILQKNPHYWNRQAISLDEIHISILPDETTAWQLFERGELDWLGGPLSPLPQDALPIIEKKYPIEFLPSAASTFCTFNTLRFPFHNLHMRKAFSYAINREEIVGKIGLLGQIAAQRPIPPTLAKDSKTFYELDNPEQARYHFKEALKELDIDHLEPITLYFKTGQVDKRLAQTLQKQWKEVLGVEVKLEQLDGKSHTHHLHNRTYQLALASWIAQFPDPISILERFKDSQNLKNYPGWENEVYTHFIQQSQNCPQDRELYLEMAEALLADQMPFAPLYHWSSPTIHSSRLENIGCSPCGGVLFEQAKLK